VSDTIRAASPTASDVRQIEQICDRFEAAWKADQRPELETYLRGASATVRGELLRHLVALDWEYRVLAGEAPRAADYESRFPTAAPAIEQVRREMSAAKTVAGQFPQQLGDYRVVRQVGRGGMGVVYEAVHEASGRRVALKLLPGIDLADATARERFWREAHTTARLNHPNIVPIFEVGEDQGHLFLALEFVAGPSLSAQLRKSPLSPRQAAELVETVARAVQYAHEQGVIHRDLKPANVLLAIKEKRSGEELPYTPKVADFGLAHPVGGSDLTATGEILGTPEYMAPEQAWGKSRSRLIGPATDVYALGAVLYAALTGRPPFQGATPLDALAQVRSEEPLPPSRLQSQTPRELETICLKCLEKEPAQRYASAAALAADLRRYLDDKPITARRPSAVERLRRQCVRKPAAAAASIFGALTLMALAGLAVNYAITMRLRREQEHTKTALQEAEFQRSIAERNAAQLAEQQGLTKAALIEAEGFRRQAERLSVNLALERGLTLLQQGDIARGMLVLGASLKIAPAEAADLTRVIRTNLAAAEQKLPFHLAAVLEHGGEVQAAVFSPDGKVLLTGGRTSGARRWDAATGEPLGERIGHEGEIRAVAYSSDGRMIATAGTDKTARLWDAATAQPIGKPLQHAHWVLAVAISPDGQTVLSGSADGTARLWRVETGEQIGDLRPPGWVYAVAFSPDGKTFATGSANAVQLWRTDTQEPIGELLPHPSEVWAVAFSPDSKRLVTGSEEGTARLWEVETGKQVGLPLAHRAAVRSVAYSGDGKLILTAGADGNVRLWDARRLASVATPVHHRSAVYAVAMSPDQRRLATACSDGNVRLWDSATADLPALALVHERLVYCVAISPDGKTIATGSADPLVRLWDAVTGAPVGEPLKHPNSVLSLAFSPDGRTLLAACSDNTARLWDIAERRQLEPVLQHDNHVYAVAFSPDGQTILTGCKDSTARLWDAATLQPRCEPLRHAGWVHGVAFHPDGKTFATACEDSTVRIWGTATGQPVSPPLMHRGPVRAVAYSPDGRLLLSGTWKEGTARLWNAATWQPLGPPLPHQEHVLSVAFSPDGKTIATGAWDGTARLWDVATGKPLGLPLKHQRTVRDVVFSPDSQRLLTASFDRTARLWEVPGGVEGTASQVERRIQVLTGMELDADGLFHNLDAAAWQERRRKLGGNSRDGARSD
jgi:WD40 repeat protein